MTEEPSSSVLLIGGPDSGKSNYLFRLWLAIDAGNGQLVSDGLPDQLEYLRAGGRKLLSGDFAQRTQHDVYNESIIPVKTTASGNVHRGRLIVPDCRGERWMSIYRKREWSTRWESHISEQTGCLLFVRASSKLIVSPLDWIQCEKMWGMTIGEGDATSAASVPTQVVLTDWLQFLQKALRDKAGTVGTRPRVGIVVAAWDMVPHDRKADGPDAYIRAEFPLLHQFVHANDEEFDFEIFGVSIAGGDLQNEPGFKDKCLEQPNPLSGGYVVYEGETKSDISADLTLPVAWAMRLANLRGS